MTKAERLLQLLAILRARRNVVVAQVLADRLNVSLRTVYRDIQSLIAAGVPVEGEAGVGYRLRAGSTLPPMMFTEEEIEALLLGVRMVQGWGDDGLVGSAESALNKIRSVLPDKIVHDQNHQLATLLVPDMHRSRSTRYGAVIRQAIKDQRVLQLDYTAEDGNQTQRKVNALGLAYWGAAWTLVAWCQLRDSHRLFRLDRILAIEHLDEEFTIAPHQTLSAYIQQYEPEFSGKAFD